MKEILTIIITILYSLLGIDFILLAVFGLPWDGYIQDTIDKIFKVVKTIAIILCILLVFTLIALMVI